MSKVYNSASFVANRLQEKNCEACKCMCFLEISKTPSFQHSSQNVVFFLRKNFLQLIVEVPEKVVIGPGLYCPSLHLETLVVRECKSELCFSKSSEP